MATGLLKLRFIEPISRPLIDSIQSWLTRNYKLRRSVTLSRTNIFIMPTRAGYGFLLMLALLWLLATNFENNLVFALTFLLTSLFVVSILHTFANLWGLTITAVRAKNAFLGEDAAFEILVQRGNDRTRENLLIGWKGQPATSFSLIGESSQQLKLYAPAGKRGWYQPGRLLVESWYPLGLLRAWSWLDLDIQALVYPAPIKAGQVPVGEATMGQGNIVRNAAGDDFHGFREYQTGDSLKHVSWKHFAREQGMYSKTFRTTADRNLWLDWDALTGMNREARLSRLCHWVLEAGKGNDSYGLRLPGVEIAPDKGRLHQDNLLKALALFEWDRG